MPTWGTRLPAAPALRAWLTVTGSLSAELARVFGPLVVQRRHQGHGRLRRDEAPALGLPPGRRVHVREVVLACGGETLVCARTVVAPDDVKGAWRALKGLGSRPLAELLFHDHRVRRSAPRYAALALAGSPRRPADPWPRDAPPGWQGARVWARRALYRRRGRVLLLTEMFAPGVARLRPCGR